MRFLFYIVFCMIFLFPQASIGQDIPEPNILKNVTNNDVTQYYKKGLTYKQVVINNSAENDNAKTAEEKTEDSLQPLNSTDILNWLNENPFNYVNDKRILAQKKFGTAVDFIDMSSLMMFMMGNKTKSPDSKFTKQYVKANNVEILNICNLRGSKLYATKIALTIYGQHGENAEAKLEDYSYDDVAYFYFEHDAKKYPKMPLHLHGKYIERQPLPLCSAVKVDTKAPISDKKLIKAVKSEFQKKAHFATSENVLHYPDNFAKTNMFSEAILIGALYNITNELGIIREDKAHKLEIKLLDEPIDIIGCERKNMGKKYYQWDLKWNAEFIVSNDEGKTTSNKQVMIQMAHQNNKPILSVISTAPLKSACESFE